MAKTSNKTHMKIPETIHFLLRNFKFIFIFTLISIFIGLIVIVTDKELSTQNTVFVSIASSAKNRATNTLYAEGLMIPDNFTETLQGWLKNPAFLSRISSQGIIFTDFGGKRQEKNNLIISYKTSDQTAGNKLSNILRTELNKLISQYNQSSDFQFSIAVYDFQNAPVENKFYKAIVVSFIIGILLGILFSLLKEVSQNKIIFSSQLEEKGFIVHHTHFGRSHKLEELLAHRMEKETSEKIQIINLHKEIKKIDPLKPTLIVSYLGHTELQTVIELTRVLTRYEILLVS